ncbi:MAG: asparaginyl-tRNA synthetase [Thelocarpon impressellum]|nr:MAG: asparaginyl-tRNA synthetase [Thelocarpon impressellum]
MVGRFLQEQFRRQITPRSLGVVVRRRLLHDGPSSAPPSSTVVKLLQSHPQERDVVRVEGTVRSVRKQKRVSFAVLGDGSTVEPLQVVLSPAQAEDLSTGAGVRVWGQWRRSPEGKEQSHELHATEIDVVGRADPSKYPLQKKFHTAEYLRTMPHLRTRTPFNSLLLRLRSHAIARLTTFFASRGYVQTHPPIITSTDCEGAGEVFTVASGPAANDEAPFFRSPKHLTVSSQLHLEALAQSVGKVWTLSPTFRAERSDTARHLSEFYMLEAEMAFVDRLGGVMSLVEEMVRDLAVSLQDARLGKELLTAKRTGETGEEESVSDVAQLLQRRWQGLAVGPWPRITYTEAIERLEKAVETKEADFQFPPTWGAGLQAEHERFIASSVGQGGPVFVTDYPRAIKAFYMSPSEASPANADINATNRETAACFDLLMPEICEVAGGSMREHRLPELLEAMRAHGLVDASDASTDESGMPSDGALGSLRWYAELRRWGSVPHGGFGLGFDRLLGYLAGVPNVREVVTFPRWAGRCDC